MIIGLRLMATSAFRESRRRCAAWLLLAGAAVVPLGACAGRDPIVDRMNVDDARYNQDLAACKGSSSPVPMVGTSVADCLKGRGYRVLMGR